MLDGTHGSSTGHSSVDDPSLATTSSLEFTSTSAVKRRGSSSVKDPEQILTTTNTAGADTTTTALRMRHSNNRGISILPRIGNINAEENQRGGTLKRKRFGWRWLLLGGSALLLFVWLLGPRDRRERVWGHWSNCKDPCLILASSYFLTTPQTNSTPPHPSTPPHASHFLQIPIPPLPPTAPNHTGLLNPLSNGPS